MKAPTVSEMKVLTAPLAPLTGRIVIVTLVAVIALTVFHGIAGLLRHENLGLGYLPRSGLTLFWLLTLLNLFVRRFRPCWSLSPAELLALFACLLVTGSIPWAGIWHPLLLELARLPLAQSPWHTLCRNDFAPP